MYLTLHIKGKLVCYKILEVLVCYPVNTNVNPESILFIGPQGLFKVVIPFEVVVVRTIDIYTVGDHVRVYRVIAGNDNELLYSIRKKYYSHTYFHYYT